jgi:hypothetical protein
VQYELAICEIKACLKRAAKPFQMASPDVPDGAASALFRACKKWFFIFKINQLAPPYAPARHCFDFRHY